jgi:hypothetical protein
VTLSPIALSVLAFLVILGGALLGTLLRKSLPAHHLTDESKDVFRLGAGLIGTISALVLGLLIASAKSSYDTQVGEVKQITGDLVLLDRLLAQYGEETRAVRALMRNSVGPLADRIWRRDGSALTMEVPFESTAAAEAAYAKLQELSPQTEAQRSLKSRAIQVGTDMAQKRLLLFEQRDNSIPMPFLAVLVFWLTIIFASFSLFARLNPVVVGAFVVFALSAAAAIFLVLDLSQPFAGVMQISSAPLRAALAPLAP